MEKASRYGTDEEWEAIPPLENQTDVYSYRDKWGAISFQKVRLEYFDGVNGERSGKSFLYRYACDVRSRCDWLEGGVEDLHYGKPPRAAGLLYNLPGVLGAMDKGETVWVMEGEKDCRLWMGVDKGVICTTAHQGAEVGPCLGQARWLRGYSDVRIVMDNDSAGAWYAFRWAELLDWNVYVYQVEGGFKDVGEAILAGVKGDEVRAYLEPVDPGWLREKAMEHKARRAEAWRNWKGRKLNVGEYVAGERLEK